MLFRSIQSYYLSFPYEIRLNFFNAYPFWTVSLSGLVSTWVVYALLDIKSKKGNPPGSIAYATGFIVAMWFKHMTVYGINISFNEYLHSIENTDWCGYVLDQSNVTTNNIITFYAKTYLAYVLT